MKRNWVQMITTAICLILLLVTIQQRKQLEQLQQQMYSRIDGLRDTMNQEIEKVYGKMQRELERSNSTIESYSLEPSGLDPDSGSLLADIQVSLKEWEIESAVTVLFVAGDREGNIPLASEGNGIYRGQIKLPLKTGEGISLKARIDIGGKTRVEELGAWGDFSMLLPLQHRGGAWSGPEYIGNGMKSQFHITIGAWKDTQPLISEPRFQVYRNGVLAETIGAVPDPAAYSSDSLCYTTDTPGHFFSLDCDPEDVIEIRFLCRDEYGLCYDFLFLIWSPEHSLPESMTEDNLILSWEK